MQPSNLAVEAARQIIHSDYAHDGVTDACIPGLANLIEEATQVSELRRVLKMANEFIVNGVEYQAGHYEAETVHHEIWAVLEGKG